MHAYVRIQSAQELRNSKALSLIVNLNQNPNRAQSNALPKLAAKAADETSATIISR